MAYKSHHVLYAYAAFLFLGGLTGFASAGFASKAKTSVIVGTVSAALALGCAVLADVGAGAPPKKGESGYKKWMIGVHLGLMLPLLLGPIFAWRAVKASAVPEKAYLAKILGALCAGSALCFGALIVLKPKKTKNAP